jgi:hypothetical protein
MKPKVILSGLEQVAEQAGLKVRYERLGDDEFEARSGRCRVRGQEILLIERRLDLAARIEVLVKELGRMDLSGIYIKPFLREILDQEAVKG